MLLKIPIVGVFSTSLLPFFLYLLVCFYLLGCLKQWKKERNRVLVFILVTICWVVVVCLFGFLFRSHFCKLGVLEDLNGLLHVCSDGICNIFS